MSCLTKKHIITYMFFFFCFSFVSVFYSPGVNAVEDVTGTVSSSTPNYTVLCNNTNPNAIQCSDFNYLIFESSDVSGNNQIFWNLDLATSASVDFRLPFVSKFIISLDTITQVWFRNPSALGTVVYNYTFTDSLSSGCPDPEPCPSCPVCPVVPENPYDQKLDDIKHAIYIGIASLFVIYFFYCIYRMIIKGVK